MIYCYIIIYYRIINDNERIPKYLFLIFWLFVLKVRRFFSAKRVYRFVNKCRNTVLEIRRHFLTPVLESCHTIAIWILYNINIYIVYVLISY